MKQGITTKTPYNYVRFEVLRVVVMKSSSGI
jgi:hypothetical protein